MTETVKPLWGNLNPARDTIWRKYVSKPFHYLQISDVSTNRKRLGTGDASQCINTVDFLKVDEVGKYTYTKVVSPIKFFIPFLHQLVTSYLP